MRSVVKLDDKAVSEIVGYVLIFSMVTVMLSTVVLVYVPYSSNTNLNNYESQALLSLTSLQNQMHQLGNTNGTQYSQLIPMGVKGTFFSQNTPTTLGFSSSSSASLSYSLGLNIQVEGHQSNVVYPFNRVIGSVSVGQNPDSIIYDPDNGYLYVANYQSESISIIDGSTNKISPTSIYLGMHPIGMTYDPVTKDLLVTLYSGTGTNQVSAVTTNTSYTNPFVLNLTSTNFIFDDVAYDQASGAMLVTFYNLSNSGMGRQTTNQAGIAIYNATNFLVVSAPITPWGSQIIPSSLTYDPANGLIYVALGRNISALNGVTYDVVQYYGNSVNNKGGIPSPWAVAFDSSTGNLYATASYIGSISGLNSTTPTNTSRSTSLLYVFDGINTKLIASLHTQSLPASLLYNPGNRYIYVANYGNNSVSIYDTQNLSRSYPIQNLTVGSGPGAGFTGMAYDPANGNVYVANLKSNNVSIIEGNTNISSGWNVQGSKLGLREQLNGSGSIYLSSTNPFTSGNLLLLQDGSVLERSQGTVTAQTALPFVFNTTTGLLGLSTSMVNLDVSGNISTSSANSATINMNTLDHGSFAVSQGQLVTLVNGSQILYSMILHVNLLSFSYSFKSSNYAMWDEAFYHAYSNSTAPSSQITALKTWNFESLPIDVTVNSTTQTITFQKTPGSIIAMTSFFINYFSYSIQFSS